jgi:hypothetical protein
MAQAWKACFLRDAGVQIPLPALKIFFEMTKSEFFSFIKEHVRNVFLDPKLQLAFMAK